MSIENDSSNHHPIYPQAEFDRMFDSVNPEELTESLGRQPYQMYFQDRAVGGPLWARQDELPTIPLNPGYSLIKMHIEPM